MNEINLTVIVIEGDSVGKYYLSYLYNSGYRVKKVIILKKYKSLRSIISTLKNFRFIKVKPKERPLERIINDSFDVKISDSFNYQDYATSVDVVKVGKKIINDNALFNYIISDNALLYLFSGGGIVNSRLLSISNKKFIHIHPGIVPDIRGADCLFWSVILRGKPGYSLFYMSVEIDEGAILHQEEFELSHLLCIDMQSYKIDVEQDSNSLLKTLDLHYRAITLVNCLTKHYQGEPDIKFHNVTKQKLQDGRMYFFMHKAIKKMAISKLLNSIVS